MTKMLKAFIPLALFAALFIGLESAAHAHGPAASVPVAGVGSPSPSANPAPGATPGGTGAGLGGATGGGGPTGGATGAGGQAKAKVAGGAGRYATTWGNNMRSPHVVRVLDIHWIDAEWPTKHREGYADSVLPLSNLIHQKCFNQNCTDLHCKDFKCTDKNCMRDKKPAMVYLYDPTKTRASKAEREMDMFGSDDIAAMTNFVHCFHMAADEVELREYHKNHGKQLPALVFIHPDGSTVDLLEGSISKSQVNKAFAKMFDQCFGEEVVGTINRYNKILKDLEKAEDDIANIAPRVRQLDYRLRKKGDSRSRALLEKANAKLEKATTEFRTLERERAKLLAMKIHVRGEEVVSTH